jgi:hypothetical protein
MSGQGREALEDDLALIGVDPQWTILMIGLELKIRVFVLPKEIRGRVSSSILVILLSITLSRKDTQGLS